MSVVTDHVNDSGPVELIWSRHVFTATIGSRRIMLDLKSGKYLTLNGAGARVWDRFKRPSVEDIAEPSDESDLVSALHRMGLLVEQCSFDNTAPARCPPDDTITIDSDQGFGLVQPKWYEFVCGTVIRQIARACLKALGLATTLRCLACIRRSQCRIDENRAARIAASSRPILSRRSRADCLPSAVAALAWCLVSGVDARLWIGVKTDPFEAHAWIEAAGRCISQSDVSRFTPIMISP